MKELITRIKREIKHLDNKLWTVEQSISREKENLVEANENLKELKSEIVTAKAVRDEEFKICSGIVVQETLKGILNELKERHDSTLIYIQKTKITLEKLNKSKLETEEHIKELEALVERVSSYSYGEVKVTLNKDGATITSLKINSTEEIAKELLTELEKKFTLDK